MRYWTWSKQAVGGGVRGIRSTRKLRVISKMVIKISKFSVLLFALLIVSPASSFAVSTFFNASSVTLTLGDIDVRSYDGAGFNVLKNAAPSAKDFLTFSTYNASLPTTYEMFFLASVADYKNQNEFGLLNENRQFVSSVKGSSALGTKATYTQNAGQKLEFGFKSPESLFFSEASKNADGQNHMLAIQVTTNTVLTIPKADQQGNSITFNLLAGDILFFMEDMLRFSTYNNKGAGSDFDFNDFATVVRAKQQEIPEPATVALLGLGALGALRRRKTA